MKKIYLSVLVLFCHFASYATHIVGGDITVKHLSGNSFEVTLHFFRDCLSGTAGFDDPITLGVYDKVTNAEAFQFSMSLGTTQVLALGDSCFTPTGLCVEQGTYISTITIPNNPNGYYISWQRCCRNNIIQNIASPGSAGMVFYAEIPNPALGNSSPVFGSYPKAYMCNSQPNIQDFSANDADGDSLAYSLVTPLNGSATSTAPIPTPSSGPYSSVTWVSPYSAANMIGGSPAMTIDAHTGILTANPNTLGVYVFAVLVEEFRGGVKIGEVRRDIQYKVIVCNTNQPPVFSAPTTLSYTLVAGDSVCIPIMATDINGDWVGLSGSSELFTNPTTSSYTSFAPDSAIATVQSSICFQSTCEQIRDTPYRATFTARDYSCYGTNVVPLTIDIKVLSPLEGNISSLIPNVFTPNNDGKNDFFKVNADHINNCFDKFDINIYNRWGELVFHSEDFHFKWDGKNTKGKILPDGDYFYIIEGSFKSKEFNYKGTVQIIR